MTIAHLFFFGLIAFSRSDQGIDAFLVNALGPQRASDGCPIPTHDAFVVAFRDDIASDDCVDEANINDKKGSPLFCSWLLHREQVSIEGPPATTGGSSTICNSTTDDCPVDISDFKLGHFALKGSCRDPKPVDCPLIGRVALPVQQIHSKSLCGEHLGFKPLRGNVSETNTAMPGDFAWADLSSPGDITLHIRKFGSLTGDRPIAVKPSKGEVDLFIVNIVNNPPSTHSSLCKPDFDHHFEMYYLLSEQTSVNRLPVPFGTCHYPAVLPKIEFLRRGLHERIICPMSSF